MRVLKEDDRVMLPRKCLPKEYILTLTPDLKNFVFDGIMDVNVVVSEATTTVVLHSRDLFIKSVSYKSDSLASSIKAVEINHNLRLHTLTLVFENVLPVGEGILMFKFQGELNDQMAGFYRSSYKNIDGKSCIMASTQFEALDARRCFPCWDEPALKATFDVTLIISSKLCAYSNMPEVESIELAGGLRRIHFAKTPKMSTYLLAFIVGEFDFVQTVTRNGVSVRVFTPPGKSEQGRFSLEVAAKSLDFYDDFFGEKYPLPKMDMVAIPEFAMGAMENWGLVTYREIDLLIDEKKASSQQKQRVCTVVAHELAHQWFGNLVTMEWWDNLWLNEGFATWMQNFAADFLYPSWQMWDQFALGAQARAMSLDSLKTSHPVQVPIKHAEEVEEVFDAISYYKGACVVRMLYTTLGEENFRKGLQLYMKRHAYANTKTTDLWGAWAEVSGLPIMEMMDCWTGQMGYPLVTVTSEERTKDTCILKVKQSMFLSDGSQLTKEEMKGRKPWRIPLMVQAQGGEPVLQFIDKEEQTISLNLTKGENSWIKLNAGQSSMVHILYTKQMSHQLCKAIELQELPDTDRAALLSDSSRAGKSKISNMFNLLAVCVNDNSYIVWSVVSTILKGLNKLLFDDKVLHQKFKTFAAKLISGVSKRCGWDSSANDGHLGKMLRSTLISLQGDFMEDDVNVVTEARTRFKALCDDPNSNAIASEYKVSAFKIVLKASKSSGKEEIEKLHEFYNAADTDVERKYIMHSLGSAPSMSLKKDVLEWAMKDVKLQDFFYPMLSVSSSNREGLDLTWAFFQERFEELKDKLMAASPSLMGAVIKCCCGGYSSAEKADEIETFFKKNPLPSNQRAICQLLESMRTASKFKYMLEEQDIGSILTHIVSTMKN